MPLTQDKILLLRKIAPKAVSIIDLANGELKMLQRLVREGYARDHSAFYGRRIPIHLRLWGITDRGRAVLEQQSLIDQQAQWNQPNLVLMPKSRPPRKATRIKPHIHEDLKVKPPKV